MINKIYISKEAEAAATLLKNIADIVADDEVAREDAIEGETNLKEVIAAAVEEIAEAEAMAEVIKVRAGDLAARKKRLEDRAEMLRAAIASALDHVDCKKLTLPTATLSVAPVPPKAIVIDEADLPSDFFEPQPPKLDRRKLLAALKDGPVPGAELSNGGTSLRIRSA